VNAIVTAQYTAPRIDTHTPVRTHRTDQFAYVLYSIPQTHTYYGTEDSDSAPCDLMEDIVDARSLCFYYVLRR